jgi:hypothetical protein
MLRVDIDPYGIHLCLYTPEELSLNNDVYLMEEMIDEMAIDPFILSERLEQELCGLPLK